MKTNPKLANLIQELKKQAASEESNLWKSIASTLEKSTRQRKAVNLGKINYLTQENDMVLVPGKVLSGGELNHKVTIAALNFSGEAAEKIRLSKSSMLTLEDFMKKNPKGKNVRIVV